MTIASAEDNGVFVEADGVTYQVHQGDVINYVYYLNVGDRATSIDGVLYVDTEGLQMITPLNEDNEPDAALIFPILRDAAVVNDRVPSAITYNFSNPLGKAFDKDTSRLISARFKVTASSGTFHITNNLNMLGIVNEVTMIQNGTVVIQPSKMESALAGMTPYGEEPATDSPTSAPTQPQTQPPTQAVTSAPTDPTPSGDIFINADGVTYKVHQGDVFDYVYYLNTGEKLCSLDGDFSYSASGLELIIPENEDELEEEMIFPKLRTAIVINASSGFIKYNYSNSNGKNFNTDTTELIRAKFRVTASSGTCEIKNTLHFLAGADEHKYIDNGTVIDPLQRSEGGVPALAPYDPDNPDATYPPTVPATAAPTSAPTSAPTDPATSPATSPATQGATPADGLFVVADGVTYKVRQGEIFEYVYYFSTGEKLCSLDGELLFDVAGLELILPEPDPDNEDEEGLTFELMFPRLKLGNLVIKEQSPGWIKYNYSSAAGKKYDLNTYALIKTQFKVTAAKGTYNINNFLHTVAGANERKFLYNDEVIEPLPRSEGGIPAKTPYDPSNPDATDPPTEAPTPAPTDPPTEKPTEKPTDPPTEKPTDPPTEAPTSAPTQPATEKPLDGLFVKADGVLYRATKGETFTYRYYLNINDRLCSLDGEMFYDNSGLSLIYPLDEDEVEDVALIFPLIKSSVVTNDLVPGRVKYNYSNTKGKLFDKDTSLLIEARFTVTASEGVYEITNILHAVAGQNEKKYIFDDEIINPVQKSDSTLPDKPVYDPDEPVDARKYGDVDNDGDITVVDASHIQRYLASIEQFDADQLKYGDVDGDGDVTVVDASHIQRWLAGILKDNPLVRFGYPRT